MRGFADSKQVQVCPTHIDGVPVGCGYRIPGQVAGVPTIGHVLHRLDFAGAEVLAADLSRTLRYRSGQLAAFTDDAGCEFSFAANFVFLCLDGVGELGRRLMAEGFAVHDLGRKAGLDLSVAKRISELVSQHHINLLHAHQYTPFFYASLSRGVLPRRNMPPVLFTEHGRHYPDVRKWKHALCNRFLLRSHDRATAVGYFVKKALVENEGLPANRIDVIPNGINPAQFAGVPVDGSDAWPADDKFNLRHALQLDLPQNAFVVLQVARFHPVKDHATSLHAFAALANEVPQSVLILAGDGPQRDAMQRLAQELGIVHQVRFVGVRTDVAELMRAADVFVLSSLSEGISVTLLEAMASGLPICATQVGGNGEVVEHAKTGLLSARGDDRGLAENLLRMHHEPQLRRQFAKAGYERLLKHFTQKQMHAGYAQRYVHMLDQAFSFTQTRKATASYRKAG